MAKKKAAAKQVKSAGSADDPHQMYLDDEAAPSRIADIDALIERYESALGEKKLAAENCDELRARLIDAFEKADVNHYRFGGRVYFLEDGGLMIKRRKAKEK